MSDDGYVTVQSTEVIPGIIAAVASALVCLTFFTFRELRCLRYVELVFYVAVNDLIASIGISLGATKNGSAACWFQGISTNYNYLSAIFWSTVITYQVWLVVCHKNVIKDLTWAHCICWGLPLIVTLLPLSTSTYANPDDDANWCFVAKRSGSPGYSQLMWFLLAYYAWVWLAMAFNVFFICTILYKIFRMSQVPDKVIATIRKLLLYPVIITICWAPITAWDLRSQVSSEPNNKSWDIFDGTATILAISQGFLFSCVFFGMNPVVRKCWWDFFASMGCCACWSADSANHLAKDDKSVVSMVSVSIKSTTASSEAGYTVDSDAPQVRRSTGGLSFLGDSSFTSQGSGYFARATLQKIQEEVDFIPAGDERMSQRLSILEFLAGGDRQSGLFAFAFDGSKSASATTNNPLNLNVNPAITDDYETGSEMQSVGTGTATMSIRRALEEGRDSQDSESLYTGGTGARLPSVSSIGTLSTMGTHGTGHTKRSKGVTFAS